jgi:hypothetical protein
MRILARRHTGPDMDYGAAEPVVRFMDSERIQPLEESAEESPIGEGLAISAILSEDGRLRRVARSIDVMALVLNGFDGLSFGDDGTYTAYVASQLRLDEDGVHKISEIMDQAVTEKNPSYCAEFVGRITTEQAVQLAGFDTQRELGI